MSKYYHLFFFLIISNYIFSQNNLPLVIMDSLTNETLPGAIVHLEGTKISSLSDKDGKCTLLAIPKGEYNIIVSFYGYKKAIIPVSIPTDKTIIVSMILEEAQEIDEIYIEATRANRSVSNLPTRTEVLTEEIDEAASMEPSKISHLITHSTGIQVQTTSVSSNGAVVRVQGLNGRYTQLLKDGFPLYGGFSGSLDVMQIPPLDLRQVEYIKGSASTLYGGGAIGGLINLISKRPQQEETLLHLNMSHIGAKDFNSFVSKKFGKFGFTNLASLHLHNPYDADKDGYSDLPEVQKFNFNPKLFFYPTKRAELYLGGMITNESRMGGDIKLINGTIPDSSNFYFDQQKSIRYTSQVQFKYTLAERNTLTIKNSVSSFKRSIQIRQNASGNFSRFSGEQLNSFSEANYNLTQKNHILNAGLNVYTDRFEEEVLDTNQLRNQEFFTIGGYVNSLWDISKMFSVESGIRLDNVKGKSLVGKNDGEFFFLPRISALFKASKSISIRLGGGMGYRMPTIFNEDSEPYGYDKIQAIDLTNVKAERSYGANADFKYQSTFGSEHVLFTFNQMFFYNLITDPILLNADINGELFYTNTGEFMHTQGFESQIKLTVWKFTWFFGYTYTDASIENGATGTNLILTPKHSIKGDLLFVEDEKWRIGWDYEFKSEQLLSSGLKSKSLFTTGIIVERTIDNFVIFLNAENFTDTRQTRYSSLISGPNNTPQFTDVWAPLDGFFFNAGLKIKL